ncbi:unnamed protein product [Nippostrongylus brasiliensis]|uniref:TraI_2_C domain-containing protein n=1 Tax=Nippostrongylus brasiliensis TaxID=27835 RepID=A0A0N4YX49_NIPBR|nr:unnamed protein product [Nippostrongylus brasiliensis]
MDENPDLVTTESTDGMHEQTHQTWTPQKHEGSSDRQELSERSEGSNYDFRDTLSKLSFNTDDEIIVFKDKNDNKTDSLEEKFDSVPENEAEEPSELQTAAVKMLSALSSLSSATFARLTDYFKDKKPRDFPYTLFSAWVSELLNLIIATNVKSYTKYYYRSHSATQKTLGLSRPH